jgi:CheY-like chemotaxis protein
MARVLIVEDHLDAARMLQLLFESEGHESRIATDGLSALDVFSSFRPEFVFLDIGLPRMDGYELAKAIRNREYGKAPHITALTGWGDLTADQLKTAGIDSYLVKPVGLSALRGVIAKCKGNSASPE